MDLPDTRFENLLDQVEQIHQAIISEDHTVATLAQLLKDRINGGNQVTAWFDLFEPLRWWRVSQQLPPFDLDVLVSWGDGRGTDMGALDQVDGWIDQDARPFSTPPIYWCALPVGPIDPPVNS
jgi:hypothetical protein